MAIEKEPSSYEKSVLSELQGAWHNLRDEVAEQAGFPGWERALFHIDEAMSWETVRNLSYEGVHGASRQSHLFKSIFSNIVG